MRRPELRNDPGQRHDPSPGRAAGLGFYDQGIWMLNIGHGQPQGNCVGWSAYDGPNPTFSANSPAPNYCTHPTTNYPIN
jgi:hypothetical protein